jgi:hypothetical protein
MSGPRSESIDGLVEILQCPTTAQRLEIAEGSLVTINGAYSYRAHGRRPGAARTWREPVRT